MKPKCHRIHCGSSHVDPSLPSPTKLPSFPVMANIADGLPPTTGARCNVYAYLKEMFSSPLSECACF